MKAILSLLLMTGLALGYSAAESGSSVSVPDFTGTWKIDRSLSTSRALRDVDDLIFVISQNLPELRVKRVIKDKKHKERTSELIYYTDGRGEKISLLFGEGEKWKSKTTLVGNTIVCNFTVIVWRTKTYDFNYDLYYHDYKETWALSQDGNTLTITTEVTVRNNIPILVEPPYRKPILVEPFRKVFHKIPSA